MQFFFCFNFRSFVQILEHILKIRRKKKKKKKSKTGIFANCSQTVRNHLALRNVVCQLRIANFALRKFCSHKTLFICLTKASKSFAKFRIAKWHHGLRKFALRNGTMVCEISHCEMAPWFAKFRIAKWHHGLRNFALRISQPCELIAKFPLFCPPILFCA